MGKRRLVLGLLSMLVAGLALVIVQTSSDSASRAVAQESTNRLTTQVSPASCATATAQETSDTSTPSPATEWTFPHESYVRVTASAVEDGCRFSHWAINFGGGVVYDDHRNPSSFQLSEDTTATAHFTGSPLVCTQTTLGVDPATNPRLKEDCEALLVGRNTLAGTATLDWSSETAMTSWSGVTLGGTPQRVTGLSLRASGLNGTIPSSFGSLAELQTLVLPQNQLTGAIPAELGYLTKLTSLTLTLNRLTGAIPAELGNLEKLRSLWLRDNRLSGAIPAEIGNLRELQGLALHNNQLSGPIPAELGNLRKLTRLRLDGNRLTGAMPPGLANLTALTQVYLAGNTLTGCAPAAWASVGKNDLAKTGLSFCAHTLTTSAGANGSLDLPPGVYGYQAGASVTITATPHPGYRVAWGDDCSASGKALTCELTMDGDKTASATFEIAIEYTLTTAAWPNGSVSPASGTYIYDEDESVTVVATPDSGYRVASWSGDCSGRETACTLTMDENKSVGVVFEEGNAYTLTTSAGPNGAIDPAAGARSYDDNESVTLKATPAAGYRVASWGGDCAAAGTGPTCVLTMDANKTASVTFEEGTAYTLTTSSGENGTIDPAPGAYSYHDGSSVTLTATPDSGYQVDTWSGACSGDGVTCTVTMDADKSASVTFEPVPTFTLTTSAGTNGSIIPAAGAHTYNQGETATIVAAPDAGYRVASWTGECSDQGADLICVVTMNASKTVGVTFRTGSSPRQVLSYGPSREGGGTVRATVSGGSNTRSARSSTAGSGATAFASGTEVTLRATPSSGHGFSGWTGVDRVDPHDPKRAFVTMNRYREVTAAFYKECSVSVVVAPPQSDAEFRFDTGPFSSTVVSKTVPCGTPVAINVKPEGQGDYHFAGWFAPGCGSRHELTCTVTPADPDVPVAVALTYAIPTPRTQNFSVSRDVEVGVHVGFGLTPLTDKRRLDVQLEYTVLGGSIHEITSITPTLKLAKPPENPLNLKIQSETPDRLCGPHSGIVVLPAVLDDRIELYVSMRVGHSGPEAALSIIDTALSIPVVGGKAKDFAAGPFKNRLRNWLLGLGISPSGASRLVNASSAAAEDYVSDFVRELFVDADNQGIKLTSSCTSGAWSSPLWMAMVAYHDERGCAVSDGYHTVGRNCHGKYLQDEPAIWSVPDGPPQAPVQPTQLGVSPNSDGDTAEVRWNRNPLEQWPLTGYEAEVSPLQYRAASDNWVWGDGGEFTSKGLAVEVIGQPQVDPGDVLSQAQIGFDHSPVFESRNRYRVRAVSDYGKSEWLHSIASGENTRGNGLYSGQAGVKVGPDAKPQDVELESVAGEGSSGSIAVTWAAPTFSGVVCGYWVQWRVKGTPGDAWFSDPVPNAAGFSNTDAGCLEAFAPAKTTLQVDELTLGQTYQVRVGALVADEYGSEAVPGYVAASTLEVVLGSPPAEVAIAGAVAQTATGGAAGVKVSWNFPSGQAGGAFDPYGTKGDANLWITTYEVEREWKATGGDWCDGDCWADAGSERAKKTGVEDLLKYAYTLDDDDEDAQHFDRRYRYRVRAVNGYGDGAWSDPFPADGVEAAVAPTKPDSGLVATPGWTTASPQQRTITVAWDVVDARPVPHEYEVRRRSFNAAAPGYDPNDPWKGASWESVGSPPITTTTLVDQDDDLSAALVYQYSVRAKNTVGTGEWSNAFPTLGVSPLAGCTLTVTANPEDGGTVSVSGTDSAGDSVSVTVPCGSTAVAQATEAEGFDFTLWVVGEPAKVEQGCLPTDGSCTVKVDGDAAVIANFTKRSYVLTTAVLPDVTPVAGTVTAGGTYEHGEKVTITATETNSEYRFGSWSGACEGSGTCEVTMDGPKSVTANFDLLGYKWVASCEGGLPSGKGTGLDSEKEATEAAQTWLDENCGGTSSTSSGIEYNWTAFCTKSDGSIVNGGEQGHESEEDAQTAANAWVVANCPASGGTSTTSSATEYSWTAFCTQSDGSIKSGGNTGLDSQSDAESAAKAWVATNCPTGGTSSTASTQTFSWAAFCRVGSGSDTGSGYASRDAASAAAAVWIGGNCPDDTGSSSTKSVTKYSWTAFCQGGSPSSGGTGFASRSAASNAAAAWVSTNCPQGGGTSSTSSTTTYSWTAFCAGGSPSSGGTGLDSQSAASQAAATWISTNCPQGGGTSSTASSQTYSWLASCRIGTGSGNGSGYSSQEAASGAAQVWIGANCPEGGGSFSTSTGTAYNWTAFCSGGSPSSGGTGFSTETAAATAGSSWVSANCPQGGGTSSTSSVTRWSWSASCGLKSSSGSGYTSKSSAQSWAQAWIDANCSGTFATSSTSSYKLWSWTASCRIGTGSSSGSGLASESAASTAASAWITSNCDAGGGTSSTGSYTTYGWSASCNSGSETGSGSGLGTLASAQSAARSWIGSNCPVGGGTSSTLSSTTWSWSASCRIGTGSSSGSGLSSQSDASTAASNWISSNCSAGGGTPSTSSHTSYSWSASCNSGSKSGSGSGHATESAAETAASGWITSNCPYPPQPTTNSYTTWSWSASCTSNTTSSDGSGHATESAAQTAATSWISSNCPKGGTSSTSQTTTWSWSASCRVGSGASSGSGLDSKAAAESAAGDWIDDTCPTPPEPTTNSVTLWSWTASCADGSDDDQGSGYADEEAAQDAADTWIGTDCPVAPEPTVNALTLWSWEASCRDGSDDSEGSGHATRDLASDAADDWIEETCPAPGNSETSHVSAAS